MTHLNFLWVYKVHITRSVVVKEFSFVVVVVSWLSDFTPPGDISANLRRCNVNKFQRKQIELISFELLFQQREL